MTTHNEQKTTIRVPAPFSLKATGISHGWHECNPISWCDAGQTLQIIERQGNEAFRISVRQTNSADKRKASRNDAARVSLTITWDRPGGTNIAPDLVTNRVRRMLKIDHDLSEFHDLCRKHKLLRPVPLLGAGRLLNSSTMMENVIKAICATNVNWTQAVKMINRLSQLGPHVPHYRNLNAWPTPKEILKAGEDYLLEICRVGYRADAILGFCDDVARGRRNLEPLFESSQKDDVPSEELLSELLAVKGIGPASAHFLLTCLGRYDRLSIDSATIYHAQHTHFNGKKPTPKQIEALYAPYGRWKNLVYWFENWMTWETARDMLAETNIR